MRARSLTENKPPVCQCIGCGCDDGNACQDLLGDPCGWLVRSKSGRLGVCTLCPLTLRLWNAGRRQFTPRALEAMAKRRQLERLSRRRRRDVCAGS